MAVSHRPLRRPQSGWRSPLRPCGGDSERASGRFGVRRRGNRLNPNTETNPHGERPPNCFTKKVEGPEKPPARRLTGRKKPGGPPTRSEGGLGHAREGARL